MRNWILTIGVVFVFMLKVNINFSAVLHNIFLNCISQAEWIALKKKNNQPLTGSLAWF